MMRPTLLYLVTHPITARHLLRGQLGWMRDRGFDVCLVTSPGRELEEVRRNERVHVEIVRMEREIAPLGDLLALLRLQRLMRRSRPTIVNASTPKAGLLGMLAARRSKVPIRIYTQRGLRLETTSGARRRLLELTERAAAAAAHRVLCVSHSLRRRCLELELCAPEKATVLAHGSSNGVDLARFATHHRADERACALRRDLGIAEGAPVIGFVGRLTRDKGIEDLRRAYEALCKERPEARLLLIGDFERGDAVSRQTRRWLESDRRPIRLGFVEETAPFYPLMGVLALPSYREGLPNAPLEAAACGVPTVGYRVTGTVDVIEDGVTGRLVVPGDIAALSAELLRYVQDPDLRRRHGRAARAQVGERFRPEAVWQALEGEYLRLLRARRLPLPNQLVDDDVRSEVVNP